MPQIQVRLAPLRDRSYTVTIRSGLLGALPRRLARIAGGGRIFIITDRHVAPRYGRVLLKRLLHLGTDAILLTVPAGERSKSSAMALSLQSRLLRGRVKRDSLVVGLGGGVIGDLAGYVASTVLRGIRFVQVPTSLLAQVDSSVGGKVGIDHPAGKNLLGAFHQPVAVFIDPRFLRTLPAVEFANGLAEVVKIAAALDAEFFRSLELLGGRITRSNHRLLTRLITRAVGLKGAVVARDEFESGLRKSLNLGHTIGHALEASTGYRLKHGFGVAIGLMAETRLAVALGLTAPETAVRLENVLHLMHLPTNAPRKIDWKTLRSSLAMDKKGDARGAAFVLPRAIGVCAIGVRVPPEFINCIDMFLYE